MGGKIFRILRMLRLLRLAKVSEIINLIIERLPSEKLVIAVDIIKLIFVMLGAAHFLGCIWYGIAFLGEEGNSDNWVVKFEYEDAALDYRYIMSYRWALSQFAGGMDEVTPVSLAEHLYSAIVFVLAFWSGNVILSILTSHMTQIYILGNHQKQQLNIMRRYLSQNGVSKGLSLRVHRNAQYTMKLRAKSVHEAAIGLEDLVSTPLRIELHFEMFSPLLSCHPWFAKYLISCPTVVHRICHAAMATSTNSEGDILFHFGEASTDMKLVKSGTLLYTWGEQGEEHMKPGNWCSEPSLWVKWAHRGELVAIDVSVIFILDSQNFQDIVSHFVLAKAKPAEYARDFAEKLNSTSEEVTDLPLRSSGGWRRAVSSSKGGKRSSCATSPGSSKESAVQPDTPEIVLGREEPEGVYSTEEQSHVDLRSFSLLTAVECEPMALDPATNERHDAVTNEAHDKDMFPSAPKTIEEQPVVTTAAPVMQFDSESELANPSKLHWEV